MYQILNSILEQENLLSNQVINPNRDNIFTNMNELCYVVSIHLFLIIVCKTLKEIRNIKRYIYIIKLPISTKRMYMRKYYTESCN